MAGGRESAGSVIADGPLALRSLKPEPGMDRPACAGPPKDLGFGVRRLGPPCRVLKHTAPQRKPAAGSIPGPTGQRFSIGTS